MEFNNNAFLRKATSEAWFNALTQAGGRPFAVGGMVRDLAFNAIHGLNKNPKDLDLTVEGLTIEQMVEILKPFGKASTNLVNGVCATILFVPNNGGESDAIDITVPRIETSTGAGRTDFKVSLEGTIESDLQRRDFTINSMALDLTSFELVDPFGGLDDVKSLTLRAHSEQMLIDDSTRIFRGVIFANQFGLDIESCTHQWMVQLMPLVCNICQEQVETHLRKLFDRTTDWAHLRGCVASTFLLNQFGFAQMGLDCFDWEIGVEFTFVDFLFLALGVEGTKKWVKTSAHVKAVQMLDNLDNSNGVEFFKHLQTAVKMPLVMGANSNKLWTMISRSEFEKLPIFGNMDSKVRANIVATHKGSEIGQALFNHNLSVWLNR